MKIDQYIMGCDAYDETTGSSFAVREVLNLKDLSYCMEINGKLGEIRFLSESEAIEKFSNKLR